MLAPRWYVAARALLALAAGCAVGASFPPYDQVWLMPVGIAGLILLVHGQRARAGLGYGWAFGMGFMLVLMPWLRVIGSDAWIALSVIEGFFYALMGLAWALLTTRRWWPPAVAAAWVGAEFLRGMVPFGGLPWGRLAFGLVETPMDRYGRIGGTALVSFLVVLVVALVVDVAMRRDLRWQGGVEVAVALAVVLAAFVLPVGLAGAQGQVTVAAVQGNVPGEGLTAFDERRAVLHNHATATRDFAAKVADGRMPKPDFVIWPENSTDIDPIRDRAAYEEIDGAVRAIGVPVLVGAVLDGPDADHVQNVGIVWSPTAGPGEQYIKQHLVPFGEYIPFRGVLTHLIGRLKEIPKDFAPGDKVGVLHIAGTPIGDLMCFEVAYDGLVRSIVQDGGQVIVVQTNNATYAGTGQLDQQFAISRYRAIESGRQVVVASTDGISGFFAADGSVLSRSAVHTQVVLERQVTLATGITLGVRLGFWVDLLLSLAALALTVAAALGIRSRPGRIAT
jgi:apolipoprotein N-acyltransferase